MKSKESLFSKNSYDTQLESLLDKKNYSDEAKSLILNIFYKIGSSYKDYKKIKCDVELKNNMFEDVIDSLSNYCDTIEILNPEETKSKLYVDRNKKIIKTFPNEVDLLQAIYYIKTPYAKNIDNLFEKIMLIAIERGMAINAVEIIRDFNGWSWNNAIENDINQYYNLLYQNLIFLVGEPFLEKIANGNRIVGKTLKNVQKIYNGEDGENVVSMMVKVCAIIYMTNSDKNEKEVIDYLNTRRTYRDKVLNKSKFIVNISNKNNKYIQLISRINSMLRSRTLLEKRFSDKNVSSKYSDIDSYKSYLVKCKNNMINRINENKRIISPFGYVDLKRSIEKEVALLENIVDCYNNKDIVYKSMIDLQKCMIECFHRKIEVYDLKKELINLVYELRYYNQLPLEDKKIKDIKELDTDICNMQKKLVKKLCSLKVIERFSTDDEINYSILKYIFVARMVNLNKIQLRMIYEDKKLIIEYYDENLLEYQEKLDFDEKNIGRLTKKTRKKIRIFV